jgi:hypothetical protein
MVSVRGRGQAVVFLAALFAILAVMATRQAHAGTFAAPSVQTDAQISAEASYLSGRALTVTCAESSVAWQSALTAVGLPGAYADEFYGFSLIAQGEMHLSPYVCAGLRLGVSPSTRGAHELQVAWSVDVLVHESTHMGRFTYNEEIAEACARVGLPGELHRLYQVAYHSTEMRRLTSAATLFRSTQAAAYRNGTCA